MPIVKLKARWAQATARPGSPENTALPITRRRVGTSDTTSAEDEEERTDACQLERDEPGRCRRTDVGSQHYSQAGAEGDDAGIDERGGQRRDGAARLHDGSGQGTSDEAEPPTGRHAPEPRLECGLPDDLQLVAEPLESVEEQDNRRDCGEQPLQGAHVAPAAGGGVDAAVS